jgi:hypothetical protein
MWYHIITIDFSYNTEEENIETVKRFYDIYRYPPTDILEKQYQYLSLPQQYDEHHLINMVHCFENIYGRDFNDTAE